MTHSPMELTVQRETRTEARKTTLTCCAAVGGGTPCGSEMKTNISGWGGEGPQAIDRKSLQEELGPARWRPGWQCGWGWGQRAELRMWVFLLEGGKPLFP